MWRCDLCGTENGNNYTFCMKCGNIRDYRKPKTKTKGDNTEKFLFAIGVLSIAIAIAFAVSRIVKPASLSNAAPEHEYMLTEWSDWSDWSSNPVTSSSTREVETRTNKTVAGYNMVHYGTQQAKDPYYRMFRDYSIGGEYNLYGARESYGEKHLTRYVSAEQFYHATQYAGNGSWVSITYNGENYQGYQMSSYTAYNFGDDNKVWFIESEDYNTTTEYRYRDCVSVN